MFVRHFVVFVDRMRQQRPASPVPSCVSMKSDRSMDAPIKFSDGGGPSNEEGYVLTSADSSKTGLMLLTVDTKVSLITSLLKHRVRAADCRC